LAAGCGEGQGRKDEDESHAFFASDRLVGAGMKAAR
jgi:hypothetical protein